MTGTTSPSTQTKTPPPDVRAWKQGVIGALNVATSILAARAILMVAVSGDIALTWLCLVEPDPYRLAALAIYSGAVVVPMILMALRK